MIWFVIILALVIGGVVGLFTRDFKKSAKCWIDPFHWRLFIIYFSFLFFGLFFNLYTESTKKQCKVTREIKVFL